MRKKALAIAAIALLSTTQAFAGGGGMSIVYDPTNYVQNALSAAKATQQVTTQLQQLQTQYSQYATQISQLKSLASFQGVTGMVMSDQSLKDLNAAVTAYKALGSSLAATQKIFDNRLTEAKLSGMNWKDYLVAEDKRIQSNVGAAASRAEMERRALQKVEEDYAFARTLDSKIPATEGMHQAMQLNNSMMARVITQNADLQRTLATSLGGQKAEEIAQKAEAEARDRAAADDYLKKQASITGDLNAGLNRFKEEAAKKKGQ